MATPGQRRGREGGQTPNAKRPTALEGLLGVGTAGPQMNAADLNEFVYRLYHDVEAMKKWGITVNDAITDHATRIDAARFRVVMERMEAMKTELEETQKQTAKLLGVVDRNDAGIKAVIQGVTDELVGKVEAIEAGQAQLVSSTNESLGELQ